MSRTAVCMLEKKKIKSTLVIQKFRNGLNLNTTARLLLYYLESQYNSIFAVSENLGQRFYTIVQDVPNIGYISGIRHYLALFEVSGIRIVLLYRPDISKVQGNREEQTG